MSMKAKVFFGMLLLLLVNFNNLFAQGTPCGNAGDPDAPACPLDTWVMVLVAVALIFVTMQLYRKQKLQNA
jgi:hypothetical protein